MAVKSGILLKLCSWSRESQEIGAYAMLRSVEPSRDIAKHRHLRNKDPNYI